MHNWLSFEPEALEPPDISQSGGARLSLEHGFIHASYPRTVLGMRSCFDSLPVLAFGYYYIPASHETT